MHGVASEQHLEEWPPAAAFFAALMTAQLALGAWLWARPTRRTLVAAATGSLAVVALWAVSRMTGLPVGPEAGRPEAVGVLDAMTVADVLPLAACSVALLRGSTEPVRRPLVLRVALVASLAAAARRTTYRASATNARASTRTPRSMSAASVCSSG